MKASVDHLHDFVFHLNCLDKQWAAIPRDKISEYWNDYTIEGVIRSKSLETLLEIVYKTHGENIETNLNVNEFH